MKFLADQDVYALTTGVIKSLGHDVATASQRGLAAANDATLLAVAQAEQRVLVTRDRDFGGLVFVEGSGAGVIYLRISPTTQEAVHLELTRALALYDEATLRQSFLVIEPGRHRIRRISPGGSPPAS